MLGCAISNSNLRSVGVSIERRPFFVTSWLVKTIAQLIPQALYQARACSNGENILRVFRRLAIILRINESVSQSTVKNLAVAGLGGRQNPRISLRLRLAPKLCGATSVPVSSPRILSTQSIALTKGTRYEPQESCNVRKSPMLSSYGALLETGLV